MPSMSRSLRSKQDWTMTFNPAEYLADHPGMTIANQELSWAKLKQYGKQLTQLRE